MATDIFVKIKDCPGESTDDKHKDWIEVLSYQTGVKQPAAGSRSTSGGPSSGRCDHSDFVITKQLDKASPKLALFCSNGKNIGDVEISLCHASSDKHEYMFYTLKDVIVTSVSTTGGGDGKPVETVSFNYGEIVWKYTEFDHKNNSKKGALETRWSTVANKGG
ncbi:MAG: type VI secretion system tube protein Hcp [Verrucomicrobia bacterium]|nr:type VI secretion system tube protein Hcp [Verrucomicrobiota bacterium]